MKSMLKLEEAAMLALSIYLFSLLDYPWWLFVALFLAPDIGIAGYAINNKVGAYLYNFFHHKGVAIVVYLLGAYLKNDPLMLAGLVLFGHSSFDRMLGYGLKLESGFKNTHLGPIGK